MEPAVQFTERRTGTRRLIDDMLGTRREMWVLYCKLAKVEPYAGGEAAHGTLEAFCEILVDYIASSHFGLYERIVEGKERRRPVREVAEEVYPRIAATTDVVLAFNDAFDASGSFELDRRFDDQLSRLGSALAQRIEHEDRIIERMLSPA